MKSVQARMIQGSSATDEITLISHNMDYFPIDRTVLVGASEYFAALLGPNFIEGTETEFILDNTDGETIRAIIEFLQTDCIKFTEANVKKFLEIAIGVRFERLEEHCWQFYVSRLSVCNCVQTFILSDKYSNFDIRQKALNVICKCFAIMPTAEIQKLEYQVLKEILKYDDFRAHEKLVFSRLLEWFQHKKADRKKFMSELLGFIRLEFIPYQVRVDTYIIISIYQ